VTRRAVRISPAFFDQLDRRLGPARGPLGEPSATDFLVVELPAVVEAFATRFDELPEAVEGVSYARTPMHRPPARRCWPDFTERQVGIGHSAPMQPAEVAWAEEATRHSWKRSRRVYIAWFALGLAALTGFAIYAGNLQDRSDELVANGVHVTGRVLADPEETLRCGQVPVPIRFPVGGDEVTYPFYVDGCGGDGLRKGQSVEVSYSQSDPTDFTVNGRVSEGPLANLVAVVGLVAGAFLVGGACIRAVRSRRTRRALEETPWQERPVRVREHRSSWTRDRKVIAVMDQDPHPVVVTQPNGRIPLGDGAASTAGAGPDTYVFRDEVGHGMVLARRPRRKRTMQRATTALE
jgi:hypothetical protein